MPKHIASIEPLDVFVIIGHQPRCYDHITTLEPIVADVDIGDVSRPGRAVDVTPIPIVEIVIAGYEVELVKGPAQLLQTAQTEVQGMQVNRRTMVVPIAQEHAGVTALLPGQRNSPIYESFAVLIVQEAIALEPKVYVSEYQSLAE